MAVRRHLGCFALGCALALGSPSAVASPPGHWGIGVERLFGVRHTTPGNHSSVSVGTQYLPDAGTYSTPRIAGDYLLDLGFSFGGALAYGTFAVDRAYDDYSDRSWLIAPRVGFFWLPLPNLGIWPRAGLTLLQTKSDSSGDHCAVSFEAPVVLLLPGHIVGFTATPYLELGYNAGPQAFFGLLSTYDVMTELGLSLGATVFF